MTEDLSFSYRDASELSDQQWHDLYLWLLVLVKKWVWQAHIPCWNDQQQEIAEDIAGETILRTLKYYQLAHKGDVAPINSLKAFSRIIAHNYFQDCIRKDRHLLHPSSPVLMDETSTFDAEQVACSHLIQGEFLTSSARAIAHIPPRQQQALLIDLANRSVFDEHATALEQALIDNHIQLREYQHLSSCSPVERTRNAALRHLAYKRLKKEMQAELAGDY